LGLFPALSCSVEHSAVEQRLLFAPSSSVKQSNRAVRSTECPEPFALFRQGYLLCVSLGGNLSIIMFVTLSPAVIIRGNTTQSGRW